MKEIVHGADYAGYTRDSKAMLVFILLTICLGVPAILYLGWWGFALFIGIGAIAMFYALRIEAFKKRHDIQTYRELLAYDQQQALTSEQKSPNEPSDLIRNLSLPYSLPSSVLY